MKDIFKNEKEKDLKCRQCAIFFDYDDLIEGACPECGSADDVFENSIKE